MPSRTSSRSTHVSALGATEPRAHLPCHRQEIAPLPRFAGAHPHHYLRATPDAPPSHVAHRLPRGGQGGGCFLTMAVGTGFQTACKWMGLQALPMPAPPRTRAATVTPGQTIKYVEYGDKVPPHHSLFDSI
jgi:hypothetical protein